MIRLSPRFARLHGAVRRDSVTLAALTFSVIKDLHADALKLFIVDDGFIPPEAGSFVAYLKDPSTGQYRIDPATGERLTAVVDKFDQAVVITPDGTIEYVTLSSSQLAYMAANYVSDVMGTLSHAPAFMQVGTNPGFAGNTGGGSPYTFAGSNLAGLSSTFVVTFSFTGSATGGRAVQGRPAGTVTAVNNNDPTLSQFVEVSATSTYGTFTFAPASGIWTYTVNVGADNVVALAQGYQVTDTMILNSADGSKSVPITVTIVGLNDNPIITKPVTTQKISVAVRPGPPRRYCFQTRTSCSSRRAFSRDATTQWSCYATYATTRW